MSNINKNTLYVLSTFLKFLGTFFLQILTVRFFGVDQYGALITLAAIPLFISNFSSMVGAEKMVDHLKQYEKPALSAANTIIYPLLKIELKIQLILIPFAILFIFFTGDEYLSDLNEIILALIFIIYALSHILIQAFLNLYLLSKKIVTLSIIQIIEPLIIVCGFLLMKEIGILAFLIIQIVKNFLMLCFFFIDNKIFIKTKGKKQLPHRKHQKTSLLVKSIWSNLDVLAVGSLSSNAFVAEYRILKSFSSIFGILVLPIWNLVKPDIIKNFAKKRILIIRKIVYKNSFLITVFSLIIMMGLYFYIEQIVFELFDHTLSQSGGNIFLALCISAILTSALTGWGRFLQNLAPNFEISLKASICNLFFLVISIPLKYFLNFEIPYTLCIGFLFSVLIIWYWFRFDFKTQLG